MSRVCTSARAVPYADAEEAEKHSFELADGHYPVPMYPTSGGGFSNTRPPLADLEWMVRALPAVLAFIREHKARGLTLAGHCMMEAVGKKFSTTYTTTDGVLPACTVTVCFPPPAVELMPDRPELADDAHVYAAKVGNRKRIHGLSGRPELNGTWGMITEYRADKVRYVVKLEATGECVLLKPANVAHS
jgi:hypothetical protein